MFNNAIVRRPGKNFADGITQAGLGRPDYSKALDQHKGYVKALKRCGLGVTVLGPDIRYPDGCFVEDTAVITDKCGIITRPGDAARQGEEESVKEILSQHMKIEGIKAPGKVDGGDILRVNDHLYIGISKRTNLKGYGQLRSILSRYGYTSSDIAVGTVLHLKTGATYIGNNNMVAIDEFSDRFNNLNVTLVDKEERYSANCLLVNDLLLMPKGFPRIKEKVLAMGYEVIGIEMSEFRKMDGGLTCLSLLF